MTAGEFGGWTPIGAVQVAGGGYDVAWKITGTGQYTVWSTDSNGNYLVEFIGAVSGNSTALESLETTFHQDLNGDGVIGHLRRAQHYSADQQCPVRHVGIGNDWDRRHARTRCGRFRIGYL